MISGCILKSITVKFIVCVRRFVWSVGESVSVAKYDNDAY
jgi:hypothetical protein